MLRIDVENLQEKERVLQQNAEERLDCDKE